MYYKGQMGGRAGKRRFRQKNGGRDRQKDPLNWPVSVPVFKGLDIVAT